MKLVLNKKKLKNLSMDTKVLPSDMTPQVAGGNSVAWDCRKPPKPISGKGGGCITTYTV